MSTKLRKTQKPPVASPKPYVLRLGRITELVRQALQLSGETLWELTGLLGELIEDDDFRNHLEDRFPDRQVDDARLIEFFDQEYLGPIRQVFGLGFAELRVVLEKFPAREEWTTQPVIALWEQASKPPQQEENPAAKRRSCSVKQLTEAEERAEKLDAEVVELRPLRSTVDRLREQLAWAQKRIGELEQENAELRAAVGNRELVAA